MCKTLWTTRGKIKGNMNVCRQPVVELGSDSREEQAQMLLFNKQICACTCCRCICKCLPVPEVDHFPWILVHQGLMCNLSQFCVSVHLLNCSGGSQGTHRYPAAWLLELPSYVFYLCRATLSCPSLVQRIPTTNRSTLR